VSGAENPSAFPYACPPEFYAAETGMTLRDWFAGQALVGFMSMVPHLKNMQTRNGSDLDEKAFAEGAFALADAMLAERSKARGEA